MIAIVYDHVGRIQRIVQVETHSELDKVAERAQADGMFMVGEYDIGQQAKFHEIEQAPIPSPSITV